MAFDNPDTALQNEDYTTIAQRIITFLNPEYPQMSNIWNLFGVWWVWKQLPGGHGVWEETMPKKMRGVIRRILQGAIVFDGEDEQGQPTFRPLRVKIKTVNEILDAMETWVWYENSETPIWLRRSDEATPSDAKWTVGFEDKLLDVKKSAETGGYVTLDRTQKWFDVTHVPAKWDPKAECPLWMKCLEDWANGEEGWGELLQKWFGYCLMSECRYAKILLMHGASRAGKGIIMDVLMKLMGLSVCKSPTAESLTNTHGLQGFEHCRLLNISEWSKMDKRGQGIVASLLKNIVGQDFLSINPKNHAMKHNVTLRCAPVIQANEYPELNDNRGALSIKIVVLPFTRNLAEEGVEDEDLDEKLGRELQGIARWAMEGAVKLRKANTKERWAMTPKGLERMHEFRAILNPIDTFLNARFVKSPKSYVPLDMLRREWRVWCDQVKHPTHVPDNRLAVEVVEKSSWNLHRGTVHEGQRVVRGMALAKRKGYVI